MVYGPCETLVTRIEDMGGGVGMGGGGGGGRPEC